MNPSKILFCSWSLHTKVDIVCIQETKMETISRQYVPALCPGFFLQPLQFVPSVGASGGLLVAWKHDLGPAISTRVDAHSTSIQFQPAETEPWWLTSVHGPQGNDEKIQFLQELRGVRAACHGPWVLAGEFKSHI